MLPVLNLVFYAKYVYTEEYFRSISDTKFLEIDNFFYWLTEKIEEKVRHD